MGGSLQADDQHCLQDGRLPIVLGVTGHRDLEDVELVRERLFEQITSLEKAYPFTPFVALSSLAEGADRLFARVILDRGIPLYVPLPFAVEEYEKDFPQSVEAFRALCHQAEAVFTVPLAASVDMQRIGRSPETNECHADRDLQYAMAGIYLAQRAHILFAIWDGKPARGIGGTAQVVNYRYFGRPQALELPATDLQRMNNLVPSNPLDDPETGIVYHVHVRRRHEAPLPHGVTIERKIPPSHQKFGDPLARVDTYNKRLTQESEHSGELAQDDGATKIHSADSSEDFFAREYRRLSRRFSCAGRLAERHVQDVRRSFLWIFCLAGIALTAETYFGGPGWPPVPVGWGWGFISLVVYEISLATIICWVWKMRRKEKNPEAVDFRALAEGLRVQGAWFRAGLPDLVSQRYLRRYSQSLGWVRYALQGACVTYRASPSPEDLTYVQNQWIDEQRKYLRNASERREYRMSSNTRWASRFIKIALLLGAVLILLLSLYYKYLLTKYNQLIIIAAFSLPLLTTAAGLLSGYNEFAAYEDDIREYRRNLKLFEVARDRMNNGSINEQQELIRQLGLEALIENANWALIHKSHDAQIPH
ncbi:hypothetical protein [Acidithiobacillus sulfuriphilus]|uniref:SMODS and SLOG-associating 2TM effector domain-containing protein n=2 Tax=Acidithiobacillus sulfuriphilus TaxID=1867749 RepID=A0A3M8R3U3_9PROT|nr:hypothetical protein [Acidithiobacillus sulfuriphilus]RNF63236.1 hypothetical protein EC580_06795 [Acidithiobacillus sulfuriphilus]